MSLKSKKRSFKLTMYITDLLLQMFYSGTYIIINILIGAQTRGADTIIYLFESPLFNFTIIV